MTREVGMKSVMVSIKPKWCDLIASGKKTIEVRKTIPKCDTPFKCYIYCTKAKQILRYVEHPNTPSEKPIFCKTKDGSSAFCEERYGNGKVIGEFVCDKVETYIADDFVGAVDFDGNIRTKPISGEFGYWIPNQERTCLTYKEILAYGDGKTVYGWHISNLVIYDEPKGLNEFWLYNNELHKLYDDENGFCCYDGTNEYGEALTDCGDAYNNILNCYRCWEEWNGWCRRLTRPPQSWCYVEELEEAK